LQLGDLLALSVNFSPAGHEGTWRCKGERRSPMLGTGDERVVLQQETYIRMNKDGVMCIQHQVECTAGQNTFVDFLMCADEPDEQGPEELPQLLQENPQH
jgi:hypothetical protein